jgi:hypothetical protein
MEVYMTYMRIAASLIVWISLYCGVPSHSFAADLSVECGMEASDEGPRVAAMNGEICEQDLSFQMSYLAFSSVFKDPSFHGLINVFLSDKTLDSPFTKFADETLGASIHLHYILFASAMLAWVMAAPVIAIKLWVYLSIVKKTGEVSSFEKTGDVVSFMAYLGFLLILIMPAGLSSGRDGEMPPLTMGQVLGIIGSLPANQGGNYMYSTFLSSTEMTSKDLKLNEPSLLPMGQIVTNAMVEGQLCQQSTQSAIMNINAKAGSTFFFSTSFGEVFDYDHDNVAERYDTCLSYVGDIRKGKLDGTFDSLSINKYTGAKENYCNNLGSYSYNYQAYGAEHSCMKLSYNTGQNIYSDIEDAAEGSDDSTIGAIKASFSAAVFYPKFRAQVMGGVNSILADNKMDALEKYRKAEELFAKSSETVFGAAMTGMGGLKSGTNEQKQVRHLAMAGFLLGGTIDRGAFGNFWENGESAFWSHSRQYPSISKDDDVVYGVDVMLHDAKGIAELIREYFCALNWQEQAAARRFVLTYNRTESSGDIESTFSGGEVKLQCVKFLSEDDWGNNDKNRYVTYAVADPKAFADFSQNGSDPWQMKPDGTPEVVETNRYMRDDLAPRLQREIQARQLVMSGYNMAVKKAVAASLVDALSVDETESERDVALRPRGWAMFGGALLYTGQHQGSVTHMAKSIDNVISVESNGQDARFIVREAFGGANVEREEQLEKLFSEYNGAMFFSIGPSSASSYSGPSGITVDATESYFQYFVSMIENLILSPMEHIKAASGMDHDKSLSAGLQTCFDEGYGSCLSGTKHPVTALSHFGSDMIDNMLILMMTKESLGLIIKATGGSGEEGDISDAVDSQGKPLLKKKSAWAKVKDFGGKLISTLGKGFGAIFKVFLEIALLIITAAHVMLTFLSPLINILLLIGILFAFILPMMAYLFGFMMSALFLVGIFSVCFVIPIYAVIKLWTIEKDYQNGFRLFYQEMLSDYFTPLFFGVSAVVSWSMIIIIMYGLNVSFSILDHGLGAASAGSSMGMFSSLVFAVFLYIIYFVCIFVLFRFGLGLMKSMADMLKEKVNLKRSGDEANIDSMQFEQYVNTRIMGTIASLPKEAMAAVKQHMDKGGFKSMKELQSEVDRAERIVREMGLTSDNASDVGKRNAENLMMSQADSQNASKGASKSVSKDAGYPGDMEHGPDDRGDEDVGPGANVDHSNTPASATPDGMSSTDGGKPKRGSDGKYRPNFTDNDTDDDK